LDRAAASRCRARTRDDVAHPVAIHFADRDLHAAGKFRSERQLVHDLRAGDASEHPQLLPRAEHDVRAAIASHITDCHESALV
jgi:hypothetical protein